MKLSTILLATFAVAVNAKSRGSHDKESGVRRKLKGSKDSGGGGFSMKGHSFKAPSSLDGEVVRGPCPAINTLANHGFINRNGKDVNMRELLQALSLVYDVTETFLEGPARSAVRLGLTTVTDASLGLLTTNQNNDFVQAVDAVSGAPLLDGASRPLAVLEAHAIDISDLGVHRNGAGMAAMFNSDDETHLQEHESSMVRQDFYFCDDDGAFPMTPADPFLIALLVGSETVMAVDANPAVTVGPTLVDENGAVVMDSNVPVITFVQKSFLDIEDICLFQRNRIFDTILANGSTGIDALNFQFDNNVAAAKGGISAQKILIMIFGQDEVLGRVDKERLRVWLEEERLIDGYAPTNLKHDPSVQGTIACQVREKFRADIVLYAAPANAGNTPGGVPIPVGLVFAEVDYFVNNVLVCSADPTQAGCDPEENSRFQCAAGGIFDAATV